MIRLALCVSIVFVAGSADSREPDPLLTSPLAEAFGSAPAMWGMRLSPDGTKMSYLQIHPNGFPISQVLDFENPTITPIAGIVAGDPDRYSVSWCGWVNDSRLLCSLQATAAYNGLWFSATRMIAVNADGTETSRVYSVDADFRFAQFQDTVLDWLPEDPDHVLVQEPTFSGSRGGGSGLSKLSVNDGNMTTIERSRGGVYEWLVDRDGHPRIFADSVPFGVNWYKKDPDRSEWTLFRETLTEDLNDDFGPIVFSEIADEVMYLGLYKGRNALFGLNINENESRLIFAHNSAEVANVERLGRNDRPVAAVFVDEKLRRHYFDEHIANVHRRISQAFPNEDVVVVDEDWNRRYYIVTVGGTRATETIYRFDSETNTLLRLSAAYPSLAETNIADKRNVEFDSSDGSRVTAYLTVGKVLEEPRGAVVLLDYRSDDFLAQFFATHGYSVMQIEYSGAPRFGTTTAGFGEFQDWQRSVADINEGTRYLIENGIAPADRICIVGWGYGGYAALMSAIESSGMYRCVASIAGATDPEALKKLIQPFIPSRAKPEFLRLDSEVARRGSLVNRADEIEIPTLLIHPVEDRTIPFSQSRNLARAMRDTRVDFELIEYENAAHDIRLPRYRFDLLTRLAAFVSEHTGSME